MLAPAQPPGDRYDPDGSSSSSKEGPLGTSQQSPALFWSPQQGVYFTYKYK
jgi:hypothetical protein